MKISQGLYAPFQHSMEMEFSKKVTNINQLCYYFLIKMFSFQIGRLPCLRSSNLMLSVIRGNDETIEIEDVFNSMFYFVL